MAGKARDYGARAIDKTRQSATGVQQWTQQQDWRGVTQRTVEGVKRTGQQVAQGAGVVAASSTHAVREHGAKLSPGSRYHPDRVRPDTKVRGAPGVWLTWLTLGWAGVHRLAPQVETANARSHFMRRFAVFLLAVFAVVVGGNLLLARIGAAPQELLGAFGLDFAAGNVTSVDEAIAEARNNAIDYAVSSGMILGLIFLSVLAVLAYWAKDVFWVFQHTRARKRENHLRKEEALHLQAEMGVLPGSGEQGRIPPAS